ncbi:DUF4349 domain-containing protein [Streptomyces sp. CHD11]|uniref:DUF4349 domain-containing protein n=1 Tax=Streptomyces sp. CHD11 TaxID=2741325 RepID=UPI001BFC9C1D|nr:DUF4349 domain-containing protein [Streptomyces sp. CHD11]MBT3153705.1 DUF4349 domain-containing protein [Streptomyces sp. CHD11]
MYIRRSVRPAHALAGVLLAVALAVTGCSGTGSDSAGSGADDKAAAAPAEGQREAARDEGAEQGAPGGPADAAGTAAPPRATVNHIIRTASLTVRVKDVPEALDEVRTTTADAGGYVGDENTRRDPTGHEHTHIELRVPVARYADVLAGLEGTGELVERRAKAEDVTDQVVDVESRITSQRASVVRIRELMDRATRLSDVVTLEGELSTRQADLESLLAQQASLKDRTSLATITLSLSEAPAEKGGKDDDEPGFVDALAGGWDVFVTMLRWLMVAVGAVLPFAAVAALLVLLWLKAVRPLLSRRARTSAPVPAAPAGPAPTAAPTAAPTQPGGGQENQRG